ncbi:DNA pilot protein [robinz microvirus RP_131]|nr:DNA pilot protein [robinz microvirus RP_131]
MWPAIISGVSGLLGGFMNSNTSAENTEAQILAQQRMQGQTQAFNAEEAEKNRVFQSGQVDVNRNWQTAMSNSAYQRSYADMSAAGLNPMAMFGSGSAASTPSGAAASGATASVGTPTAPMPQNVSPFKDIQHTVTNAMNSAIQAKTLDKMTEEISNLEKTRLQTEALTESEKKRPALIQATTETERHRPENVRADTARKETDYQRAKLAIEREQYVNELWQNDYTRKILQGGIVGESAGKMTKPLQDILEGIANTALRKRGLDQLRDRMRGTKETTQMNTPDGWTRYEEFNPAGHGRRH